MTLCASALLVSVSSLILPEGNLKKYAYLVSSVMISLSIVAPLKGLLGDRDFLSFDDIEYSEMRREDAEEIYHSAIEDEYKKSIEESLSVYGRAYVHLNEDLSVSIIEIYATGSISAEDEAKIREETNCERLEIKYGDY